MFKTNTPVTAGSFFDREDKLRYLNDLVQSLSRGQPVWLAILGSRKIGKTSLLLEAKRRTKAPDVAFVIIDTFEEHPPSLGVFRRLALRVIDAVFATEAGVSLEALARRPAEYRRALQKSDRFISLSPDTKSTILELPEQKVDSELVREALQLPEQIAEALGLHLLVAWDEFQQLARLNTGRGAMDLLPFMRSIWQRHQRVAYVISGSERTMMTSLVSDDSSPFFQHFSIMELNEFTTDQAVDLLVKGAPEGRSISRILARKAVRTIGGHPFYIQLLGETLTAPGTPIDEAALKAAVQELMFSRTGRLALYFENEFKKTVGRAAFLSATLNALTSEPKTLTEIAKQIGAPSGATVRYLERLGDTVTRDENKLFHLSDPAFGLWLRWRQPGGTVVPMTLIGDEAEKDVATHLAKMGFELVYQSRASRGAFDLLATRGHYQLALQVRRSPLPIRFKKSEWNRMKSDAKRYGWCWVIAAVDPKRSRVVVLDPATAKIGREVRLGEDAEIENVLLWLED